MTDYIQPITQIVGALTGVGTFTIAALVLRRSNHLVEKVGEIHEQTNGMAAKLNEKTEIIAHAAGLQEGLTQQIAGVMSDQASLAPAAATAAALLLDTAAAAAKEIAAKALVDAKPK
jgi:hypothetical protein